MMRLELARTLADAVMVEGYTLYPYRATAVKNRFRWTFGVLAPRAWSEAGGGEPWWLEAQILVAGTPQRIAGELRFFQIERRRIEDVAGRELPALEADGRLAVGWDEGIVQTIALAADAPADRSFSIAGQRRIELLAGGARVVHERRALTGRIAIRREPIAAWRPLVRIAIRIENTTPWTEPCAPRDRAIAAALASTHLLVGVSGGELLSVIDPPDWARDAAARCRNVGTYPVLAGPPGSHDVMLAAPFILYDHPHVAPESAGDLCDATEIDELLVLRTRTLTDDEKRLARATDARAAAIVDRADALPADRLARLHGAARDLRAGEMVPRAAHDPDAATRRPVPPLGAKVKIAETQARRTDAQDALFAGRIATVAAVRHDVDGTVFLAVTLDDDPAAELHDWYGRYHYYRLDEVEPT